MRKNSYLKEVIREMFREFIFFVEINLKNMSTFLEIMNPYFVIFMIIKECDQNVILGMPLVIWFVSVVLRKLSRKKGKGDLIPVPSERFTEKTEYDEVFVEENRLQEMLLYLCDVEDYLEKIGKM